MLYLLSAHHVFEKLCFVFIGQQTGTDGELCPLICPVDCPDDEILCPGGTMPNTCKENDYCHPKGVGSDGNTCPGYCPEDCEDDEDLSRIRDGNEILDVKK